MLLAKRLGFTLAATMPVVLPIRSAAAQPADTSRQAAPRAEGAAETIIVTGSRFGGRTAVESSAPVDAIPREELQQGGRVDLIQMLKVQVPSFSTPHPLASGVADYLQPPSLRGLGPGEVLVLVNGKRQQAKRRARVAHS